MIAAAMFVNCPHCQSLVAVDAVTGAVPDYCPYCDGAIAEVMTQAEPEPQPEPEPEPGSGNAQPDTDPVAQEVVSMGSDATTPEVLHDRVPEIPAAAEGSDEAPSDVRSASAAETRDDSSVQVPAPAPAAQKSRKNTHPSFAKRSVAGAVTAHNARWPWPVAAGLMLLLLLQIVVADRASLAAHPRWRATIASVCNVLRCDIPPWRETAAFTMLARNVQAHPGVAGALRIRAAFRNDARWPQPWPQLVVTLSDASGRVTGSRTFSADEYLGAAPTQKVIATGQIAAVALEIKEPAPDTVSFSFDFR